MIEFKTPAIGELDFLNKRYNLQRGLPCDFSAGCAFMWRRFYNVGYAIVADSLVMRYTENGKTRYSYPLGGEPETALCRLTEENEGGELSFCYLTDAQMLALNERFPTADASCDRGWCDYIYKTDDIVSLSGRKYSGQRNHIHKFRKLYPDAAFSPIDSSNIAAAREFITQKCAPDEASDEMVTEEHRAILEVLDNYDSCLQSGGLLTVGGKVVGLSFGEVVGNTLIVHIEKADRETEGAYPVLVNEFAKMYAPRGGYINREEDCNLPGLRVSKLSYHPCRLLQKWNLTTKINERDKTI